MEAVQVSVPSPAPALLCHYLFAQQLHAVASAVFLAVIVNARLHEEHELV